MCVDDNQKFDSDVMFIYWGNRAYELYYINGNKWQEIYSYADLRFSSGDIYKKLGFELVKQNPPNYFYVKGLKRFHRYGLRKLPTESRDIPEWRLRMDQGYFRIWDCGTLKFSITK